MTEIILAKMCQIYHFLLTPRAWILYHYYSFPAATKFSDGGISHSGLYGDSFFFHSTTDDENAADGVNQ
jgi:hypothetical protein